MALILKHQTPEAFIARLRQAYRDSNAENAVKLARFIVAKVQAGDITDAQCRAAFGLNTAQWAMLKARMNAFVAADNTIKSAIGE